MIEATRYDLDNDLMQDAVDRGKPQVRVRRYPRVDVVLGRSSKPSVELHMDAVLKDGVPVLRRPGGGCAVVLDPGNVVVSVALPLPGVGGIKSVFTSLSEWLIQGLTQIGFCGISMRGISDLAVGDRKVGGACVYRTRGLLYYSATVLVEPDVALIERYLRHPPREPDYRAGRSHSAFLGSLRGLAGPADTAPLALALAHILATMVLQCETEAAEIPCQA